MTRLLISCCAAGLLALPAFAQAPQPTDKPAAGNPAAATGMMSSGSDSGAATKSKSNTAASEDSAAKPAKKRTARADTGIDPEHAQIVELNRRELQRIESGQK